MRRVTPKHPSESLTHTSFSYILFSDVKNTKQKEEDLQLHDLTFFQNQRMRATDCRLVHRVECNHRQDTLENEWEERQLSCTPL